MVNPDKDSIRKEMLKRRGAIPSAEVMEKSHIITEKLLSLKEFKEARLVMSYIDFRNEVSTRKLIAYCLGQGKQVCVPAVVTAGEGRREIEVFKITNLDEGLVCGSFGILEPLRDKCEPVLPWEIDMAIIPGVAFDRQKNRLGFGAGFYDRFLTKLRTDCQKAGIAFELQIIDELPVNGFDIPMDIVITERYIYI